MQSIRITAPLIWMFMLLPVLRCAQNQYDAPRLSFRFPVGWTVRTVKEGADGRLLHLAHPGDPSRSIVVAYERMRPDTRVYWLHEKFRMEFILQDKAIEWRHVQTTSNRLPTGEAMKTVFRRDGPRARTRIQTTVTSAGDAALIVFEFDHRQESRTDPVDELTKSLRLGDGGIEGMWNGPGALLTLHSNGRAEMTWNVASVSFRSRSGYWEIKDDEVHFRWTQSNYGQPSGAERCAYRHEGSELFLKCADSTGELRFTRH